MTVRDKIKNGKDLLDDPKAVAEGTEVIVRPVKARKPQRPAKSRTKETPAKPSFADRFRDFIGKAKGLPADMSVNLDHYLYGAQKQG